MRRLTKEQELWIKSAEESKVEHRFVPLSRGLLTIVDAEDYHWITKEGLWTAFDCSSGYYAGRKDSILGLRMLARVLVNPAFGLRVDHINGDSLDNRKWNLQAVTPGENRRNKHNLQRSNQTRFEGVWQSAPNTWLANITLDGKRTYLGSFHSLVEAAQTRLDAEVSFFGEERCQNSSLHQSSKELLKLLLEQTTVL